MKKLHRAEGFTLIELMIVILIIAILVAIAVPIYINATNQAKKRTCQANLRIIDGANATFRADNNVTAGLTPANLFASDYLKKDPHCPAGANTVEYVLDGAGDASCMSGVGGHTYP